RCLAGRPGRSGSAGPRCGRRRPPAGSRGAGCGRTGRPARDRRRAARSPRQRARRRAVSPRAQRTPVASVSGMVRWTRAVLRFRWPILGVWLVILLFGAFATSRLSALLSNTFTVPGSDSERARTILQDHFGDRSDGEFLVIYKVRNGTAGVRLKLERSIQQAATAVP